MIPRFDQGGSEPRMRAWGIVNWIGNVAREWNRCLNAW
jgi:hypothetical protein